MHSEKWLVHFWCTDWRMNFRALVAKWPLGTFFMEVAVFSEKKTCDEAKVFFLKQVKAKLSRP